MLTASHHARGTVRAAFRGALLLLALPSLASTQKRDTTRVDTAGVRLPAVEVIGSVLPLMGPSVGSGVPARTTVVGQQELQRTSPRLVTDQLALEPGASLYDDLGSPLKATLTMRGFTVSPVVGLSQGVTVFLDGIPMNEPDAGQVNFDLLPMAHLARLEILTGTASLLGPNSLGGAVNLRTPTGEGPIGGSITLSGGSWGHIGASGAFSGSANGWRWFAGAEHGKEEGWRQLTDSRQQSGLMNFGRRTDRGGVNLQLLAARSRAETAGSLPLTVFAIRPDSNLTPGDFEDLNQVHVAASGHLEVAGGRAALAVYHRRHDAERFNVNQLADPDVRGFSANRSIGVKVDWIANAPLAGGALGMRVGTGGSANGSKVRLFTERIDPGLTTHVESPIRKVHGYAVTDWVYGPLAVTGGVRWDRVTVPFRNVLNPTRDTTSHFERVSPRAGMRFEVGQGAALYASAARGFRAPAVIELACADPEEPCPLPFALGDDPPLAPVVATTTEIGMEWVRGSVRVLASLYRTDVRDDIFLFPYDDEDEPEGSTIDGYFANIPATRREGLELSSRWAEPGRHGLAATLGVTRATFRSGGFELFSIREAAGGDNDVEAGDQLPLIPNLTGSITAWRALPGGLEASATARHVGRRWMRGDEANEERPLSAYSLLDARLALERRRWGASLVIRNVADARHATFGTFNLHQDAGNVLERFLTPGTPRAVQLSVSRTFGGAAAGR